jgi:hypothetical protein
MPAAHPPEHWRQVAAVWLAAWQRPPPGGGFRAPTKAVANHFGVNYGLAAAWVRRARVRGYLTTTYQAGHTCPGCGRRIRCGHGRDP